MSGRWVRNGVGLAVLIVVVVSGLWARGVLFAVPESGLPDVSGELNEMMAETRPPGAAPAAPALSRASDAFLRIERRERLSGFGAKISSVLSDFLEDPFDADCAEKAAEALALLGPVIEELARASAAEWIGFEYTTPEVADPYASWRDGPFEGVDLGWVARARAAMAWRHADWEEAARWWEVGLGVPHLITQGPRLDERAIGAAGCKEVLEDIHRFVGGGAPPPSFCDRMETVIRERARPALPLESHMRGEMLVQWAMARRFYDRSGRLITFDWNQSEQIGVAAARETGEPPSFEERLSNFETLSLPRFREAKSTCQAFGERLVSWWDSGGMQRSALPKDAASLPEAPLTKKVREDLVREIWWSERVFEDSVEMTILSLRVRAHERRRGGLPESLDEVAAGDLLVSDLTGQAYRLSKPGGALGGGAGGRPFMIERAEDLGQQRWPYWWE